MIQKKNKVEKNSSRFFKKIYMLKDNNIWHKDYIKILLVVLPIAIIMFILNFLTPLYADDYGYSFVFGADGQRVNSILDIFSSQYTHYFTMNGRTVTHFIAQLFLLMGKPVFNYINTLVFVGFGLIIYYHGFLSFKKIKILPLIFIYFALLIFTPDFGQSFLWTTGASNYLYGPLITLLFLLPYRKSMNSIRKHSIIVSLFMTAGMLFLGLLAGNANENNGVLSVIVSIVFIIYSLIEYKKVNMWCIGGAIGAIIGCLFMLLSPGTRLRTGDGGLSLTQIPKRIFLNTFSLFDTLNVLLLIFVILLCVFVAKQKSTSELTIKKIFNKLKLSIIYFVAFLFSFYSLSVAPGFPLRTWSTFIIFLIISIIILYYETIQNYNIERIRIISIGTGICLAAIIIGTFGNNFFELKMVDIASNDRINTITQSINCGKKEVYLYSISSNNKYSCFDDEGDLDKDSSSWKNKGMAQYYGIEKINLE